MELQERKIAQNDDLTLVDKFGYTQELQGSMNVLQLTAFGLNYMLPLAPAVIFGVLLATSGGTVALPFLLAGIAMLLTAFSYSTMVKNFPLAGSVYSYVGRGWNPHFGFLAGWVVTLDYVLIPTITSVSAAYLVQQYFPTIPFWILLGIFSVGIGLLNLFGVELMSKMGIWFLILGEFVVWTCILVWGKAVYSDGVGTGTLISSLPFQFDSMTGLVAATSLAVLSFLGFDAITTLAEETRNPKKDIPRAIFLCIGIGLLTMVVCSYIAMLAIPNWRDYIADENWMNTVLFQVSILTGGDAFGLFFTAGFLSSLAVFNLVATAAGARLLYGMGRDNLLPKGIFAAINKRFNTPHFNIILIVAIEFVLGITVDIGMISNLVNYGAFFGFAALNLSVIWLYYIKKKGEAPLHLHEQANWKPFGIYHLRYMALPALGFVVIAYVWSGMDKLAFLLGTVWLIIGIAFLYFRTNGFKKLPPQLEH
ncbi:APC family permease [Robertmurraya korlensis]|uniref:APC family permease n=1 Tax=Robertmurraya korlensis TaxID=519977 RepID=UPI00082580E2|nr:APC family permease [Robertmurraya korlensis]